MTEGGCVPNEICLEGGGESLCCPPLRRGEGGVPSEIRLKGGVGGQHPEHATHIKAGLHSLHVSAM